MRRLTAVGFVRAVTAVEAPVAAPHAMDTNSVAAEELLFPAGRSCGLVATVLGPFVRAVGTISVPVARPQLGHADGVVALEGAGGAGGDGAGGLIAAVRTV